MSSKNKRFGGEPSWEPSIFITDVLITAILPWCHEVKFKLMHVLMYECNTTNEQGNNLPTWMMNNRHVCNSIFLSRCFFNLMNSGKVTTAEMACLGRFHGNRSGWLHLLACNQDLAAMRDIQLWASVYGYLLSTWSHEIHFPCHKIALVNVCHHYSILWH